MRNAIACLLFTVQVAIATHSTIQPQTERQWCEHFKGKYNAIAEAVLWDDTRVDLLSPEYAIEVDFARSGKNFEAIGQAMYYGIVTDRKPAVLLLLKSGDERFVYRTQTVCAKYGIRLFVEKI